MTMKVECYGCGQDCSHAYGTYFGYPYHFGCLPVKRKGGPTEAEPDKPYCKEDQSCCDFCCGN